VDWWLLVGCVVALEFSALGSYFGGAWVLDEIWYRRQRGTSDTWKIQPRRWLATAEYWRVVRLANQARNHRRAAAGPRAKAA
jgi:hypothetical protein